MAKTGAFQAFYNGRDGTFWSLVARQLDGCQQTLEFKNRGNSFNKKSRRGKSQNAITGRTDCFHQGEVESFELPAEKFDAILHMATTSAEETFQGFSQTQKLRMLFEGTQRVIELAQKSGAKRILFTSSGAVYGSQLCDHIQETAKLHTDPLRAESGLALGKSVAEFLLSQASTESGLEVVIARCFSFVGPGIPMNLHYAIGNFIKNAIEGKPIVIRGDGSAIRSYMFMGDLICWLLKLLLDGKSGEAYNVGSNKPISILELAHRVSQLSSTASEVVVLGETQYTVGVPVRDVYVPSIDKASNLLNLNVPTELRQSLIYTFNSIHK